MYKITMIDSVTKVLDMDGFSSCNSLFTSKEKYKILLYQKVILQKIGIPPEKFLNSTTKTGQCPFQIRCLQTRSSISNVTWSTPPAVHVDLLLRFSEKRGFLETKQEESLTALAHASSDTRQCGKNDEGGSIVATSNCCKSGSSVSDVFLPIHYGKYAVFVIFVRLLHYQQNYFLRKSFVLRE